jgi:hypothetical protein
LFAGNLAHAEDINARRIREAKDLFQVVKTDLRLTSASERCALSATWSTYPIPQDVARAQFGVTIQADLVAPELSINTSSPAEVINSSPAVDSAYCNDLEWKAYATEKKQLVASQQNNGASASREQYSFPVFNASFTKAAFVSQLSLVWWRYIDSNVKFGGLTYISLFVYKKANGHWSRSAEVVLAKS